MKKNFYIFLSFILLFITGFNIAKTDVLSFATNGLTFNSFSSNVLDLLEGKNPQEDADKIFDINQDLTTINNTLMVDSTTFGTITKSEIIINNHNCEVNFNNKKVSLQEGDNLFLVDNSEIIISNVEPILKNNKFYFPLEDIAKCLGFEVYQTETNVVLSNPYQSKRLIVKSNNNLNKMGATKNVEGYKDFHIFEYSSEEACKNAYEYYNSLSSIDWVSVDKVYSINDEAKLDVNNKTTSENNIFGLNDNFSYSTWGATPMGVENYSNYLSGLSSLKETIIAVLDTGLDSDHEWFKNRVVLGGKNFSTSKSTTSCEYEDVNGHGTHVAGTIVDLTLDNVKILPIKIMDDDGFGYTTNILLGLEYIIDLKNGEVTITNKNLETVSFDNLIAMNLSFGGTGSKVGSNNYNMYNQVLTSAYSLGVLPVVAAGNDGINVIDTSPANVSCAITVSAVGQAGKTYYHPHWSNWGEFIDVCAPGEDIVSACVGGGTISLDGTSMAAPHVAGAVALLYSGGYNLSQIESFLLNNSLDLGISGWDNYYGNGFVNISYAYAELLEETVALSNITIEHDNSFELLLSFNNRDAVIFYTLDNTEPNINSNLYNQKIIIDKTLKLRAKAFVLDNNNKVIKYSKETSQTFVIAGNDIENAYTISENGELLSYNGVFSNVIVPSSYNGKTITSIGSRAFIGADPSFVFLPASVTTIGRYAFYGCSNLEEVKASKVTEIGMYAFYSCESYTYLTDSQFPNLQIIDKYAFSNCGNLNNISLSNVQIIDYFAFCMNLVTPLNLVSINLPNIKILGDFAFYGASLLQEVNLPKVEIIGSKTFMECKITQLDLPNAKYLGSQSFEANNLVSVALPEVILIGSQCFYNCNNLKSAIIPKVEHIASLGFARTGLTNVNMPHVESLGVEAFYNCTSLRLFNAPKLKTIKSEAFYNCLSLQEISLPNVVSIEKEAFYNITKVSKITLSPYLNYISSYAFNRFSSNCVFYIYQNTPAKDFVLNFKTGSSAKIIYVVVDSQLSDLFLYEVIDSKEVYIKGIINNTNIETLEIPNYIENLPVTKICAGAFKDNSSISKLCLMNVETIEAHAFENCINLTSIELANVKTIGDSAFSGCNNLTQVEIEKVEELGEYAFYNCAKLLKIKLGDNVSTINFKALGYKDSGVINSFTMFCHEGVAQNYAKNNNINVHNIFKALEKFYFNYYDNNGTQEIYISLVDGYTSGAVVIPSNYNGYNITKIGDKAFEDCVLITHIKLPDTITNLGDSAFYNCTNLVSINLENIKTIGKQCFSRCENLRSVKFNVLEEIPIQAFANCYNLELVEIPQVKTISDQAFYLCIGLITVISPNLQTIGYGGFLNAYKLKNINLNAVKTLGTKALTSRGTLTIDGSVFQNCYELTNFIYLPKIEELGDQLFNGSGVTKIAIGNNFRYYDETSSYKAIHSNIIIYGYVNSYAQTYSTRNGNTFVGINEFKIINNSETKKSCLQKEPCTISVNAKGLNLKYQWYEVISGNAQIINNETNKTLNVDTSLVGIKTYYVVITNWDDETLVSSNYSVNVLPSYEIKVTCDNRGTVTAEPSGRILPGGNATYYVKANEGCYLVKIIVDGIVLSDSEMQDVLVNGYTFSNVTSDHTFEVEFGINTYLITVSSGQHGRASCGQQEVAHGANFTVNFYPDAGYHVEQILVDGVNVGKANSYTFVNVKKSYSLEVIFAETFYKINLRHNSFGNLSCDKPLQNIANGEDRTFTIFVEEGYYVDSVKCNGKKLIVENNTFTISNISEDINLEIDFKEINPTINEPTTIKDALILFGIIAAIILVVSLPVMILKKRRK